jgi:hypothetical protein
MMKRFLLIATATLLTGAALAPAQAQGWDRDRPAAGGPGWDRGRPGAGAPGWDRNAFWRGAPESPRERIAFLQQRIDRAAADGSLDRREARNAQRELDGIRNWAMRLHMRDGRFLSDRDRDALQAKLDGLSGRLRWMRHNGW